MSRLRLRGRNKVLKDANVIFFYLTGVGFEVKEPPAKYKRGKKTKAKK
jgi:hypothetical protein